MSTYSEHSLAKLWLGRCIERSCWLLACLGGALFILEAVMSVISVIGRTFFSMPILGDYELIQFMSAMGIALCLPYCQLKQGHVFVDFFTLWAPAWLKRYMDAIAAFLLACLAFFLAWRSWDGLLDMREYQESSMVLGLPIWWGYAPIVPSLVLLGLTALYTLTQQWSGAMTKAQL